MLCGIGASAAGRSGRAEPRAHYGFFTVLRSAACRQTHLRGTIECAAGAAAVSFAAWQHVFRRTDIRAAPAEYQLIAPPSVDGADGPPRGRTGEFAMILCNVSPIPTIEAFVYGLCDPPVPQ